MTTWTPRAFEASRIPFGGIVFSPGGTGIQKIITMHPFEECETLRRFEGADHGGPRAAATIASSKRSEFTFRNKKLCWFLDSDAVEARELPQWSLALAGELKARTHRSIFDITLDERPKVPRSRRSLEEIQSLVCWSVPLVRSCSYEVESVEELLEFPGSATVEMMLFLYEHWYMNEENWGFYIDGADYPGRNMDTRLQASIGNVAAATGLAVLDRLLERMKSPHGRELGCLSLSWDLARIAGYHVDGITSDFFDFFDRKRTDRRVPADLWGRQARVVGKSLAAAWTF